jgi:hypothetical protein
MSRAPMGRVPAGNARPAGVDRRLWIALGVVVGGVIVFNLLAQGLDRAVGGDRPSGATGSSYATAPGGLAAFGSLLARYDHGITQQRGAVAQNPPPSDATVFVIEPSELTRADADALLQFVTSGGRLVVGGAAPFYLHNLSDKPPAWQPDGATAWTASDPGLGNVHDIEGAGVGSWSSSGAGTVVVGANGGALLTRDQVGQGEILFLADPSPLENAYLATGDDAAFGLSLAGAGRPVVFPEGVHGYGTSRGLAAIPDRWKIALALVAAAALALMWSRARRFGPPDRSSRALPPARAEYVRAVSISLERTHDPAGALRGAQEWTRARIVQRAALGPNADNDQVATAARSFGCTDEEIAALLGPVSDDAGALALGRAVARVGGNGRMQ